MVVSQRLDLKVSQGLSLTPQLREAIELLQLSSIDLEAFVQAEMDQNPFLEKKEDGESFAAAPTGRGGSVDFENFLSTPQTFRDHLLQQVQVDLTSDLDRKIAVSLIDLLDEDGYLRDSLEEISLASEHSLEDLRRVLKQVRSFDPCGVFARNLHDCFEMQLRDKGFLGDEISIFVSNLELVATQSYTKLAKLCGVSEDSILDYVDLLKTLDPKPAQSFLQDDVRVVTPDVLVRKNETGQWQVSLNASVLPAVIANNDYYADIKEQPLSKQDKVYMSNTYQRANWLVKALDQRAKTILSVAQVIMNEQEAFLNRGAAYLRPLILKQVAEAVEMHESTISRVTSNKYILTHWGVFELKSFFSSKLSGAHGGEEYASSAIQSRIKEIIAKEDKFKPLSDDKIVKMLQSDGVNIARRTVAKYRDVLKIPSTSLRRIKRVS